MMMLWHALAAWDDASSSSSSPSQGLPPVKSKAKAKGAPKVVAKAKAKQTAKAEAKKLAEQSAQPGKKRKQDQLLTNGGLFFGCRGPVAHTVRVQVN